MGDEIAMRAVNLYTIEPSLFGPQCTISEFLYYVANLSLGELMRNLLIRGAWDRRRSYRLCTNYKMISLSARMIYLRYYLAAIPMNTLGQFGMALNLIIIP